jgi:sulfur carrier protein
MIRVNGEPRPDVPVSLIELLAAEGVADRPRGVAVALNGAVVPRSRWPETRLAEGDEVEIVKVLQGG